MTDVTRALMWFTGSQRQLDMANLTVDDINVADIEHNLPHVNRWCGNTQIPYSVMEHSIMVACMAFSCADSTPEDCIQALAHDDTEAYIGDIPAPIKHMFPELVAYEKALWALIAGARAVPAELSPVVKFCDWVALYVEATCLLPGAADEYAKWQGYDEHIGPALAWIDQVGGIDTTMQKSPESLREVSAKMYDQFYRWRAGEIAREEVCW